MFEISWKTIVQYCTILHLDLCFSVVFCSRYHGKSAIFIIFLNQKEFLYSENNRVTQISTEKSFSNRIFYKKLCFGVVFLNLDLKKYFWTDFFGENCVFGLCFRTTYLIDCTSWYHSSCVIVLCFGLKSENCAIVQSVLHNLAGVKSCFLKLSEELEWRNNDI